MKEVFAGGPNGDVAGVNRSAFIRSTYMHLSGAIVGFIVLSTAFYFSGLGIQMLKLLGASRFVWLAFLGGFMLAGKLATGLADNAESNEKQLMGLAGYVLAESLIFAPLFALAGLVAPEAIPAAGLVTLLLVGGLTWTAFSSKTDFSFLGGFLRIAGMVALGAIIAGVIFGFSLGIWFSAAMVMFAGGCVLYDTSNIIRHYPTNRPAGAALHLFASIALMLWYVLRILLELSRRN
jgi:FtsH-binding integral membrane protein